MCVLQWGTALHSCFSIYMKVSTRVCSSLNTGRILLQVDMPVFFYIDPEFAEDPKMEAVDTLTLSYTFFEAKAGLKLPVPSFMKQ